MREILFRGKMPVESKWAYGSLISEANVFDKRLVLTHIYDKDCNEILVDPKTVGQYTGLTDKNGKKIFEGDICWFYGGEYYSGLWEQNAIVAITDMTDDEQTHYLNSAEYCEVIGNIYDNPELLDR